MLSLSLPPLANEMYDKLNVEFSEALYALQRARGKTSPSTRGKAKAPSKP
jgi:hypothetical protein